MLIILIILILLLIIIAINYYAILVPLRGARPVPAAALAIRFVVIQRRDRNDGRIDAQVRNHNHKHHHDHDRDHDLS